ncbi:unnamed protein product, partial [Coffea canephora]
ILYKDDEPKLGTDGKVIVSLGRHDAVARFPFTTLIGLLPCLIISKDLFTGKTRKLMDLDPRIVRY